MALVAISSATDPAAPEIAALAAALAADYVIESEIGRGGMCVVYRARDVKAELSAARPVRAA